MSDQKLSDDELMGVLHVAMRRKGWLVPETVAEVAQAEKEMEEEMKKVEVPQLNIESDGLVLIIRSTHYMRSLGIKYGDRHLVHCLQMYGVSVLNNEGRSVHLHSEDFEWCHPHGRALMAAKPMKVWRLGFRGNWIALLTWTEVFETLTNDFEEAAPGDGPITLERIHMTQGEFANLGDFEGW